MPATDAAGEQLMGLRFMGEPAVTVDRNSPVPLYFQVAKQLESAILSGKLPPGSRLDNEIQLAEQFGLSRPTMRQAIQHLVDRGLLVRKRGVGTQVVSSQVRRPVGLTSLYDDLAESKIRPQTKVLVHEVVPARDDVAAALNIAPGDSVYHLERLRYAQEEPLALMRNWLPVDVADLTSTALEQHGLYQLIRAAGVHLRIGTQTIGARAATPSEARLLTEPRSAPLLTMTRTTYDDSGRAVEFASHVYRAARYSFELTLVER
jgi:DNA-binding GntR family transcriptional regulator